MRSHRREVYVTSTRPAGRRAPRSGARATAHPSASRAGRRDVLHAGNRLTTSRPPRSARSRSNFSESARIATREAQQNSDRSAAFPWLQRVTRELTDQRPSARRSMSSTFTMGAPGRGRNTGTPRSKLTSASATRRSRASTAPESVLITAIPLSRSIHRSALCQLGDPNQQSTIVNPFNLQSAIANRQCHRPPAAVVVIFFTGGFGFARSLRCSSIFRRGTPFTIQSGAGAPIR